MRDDIFWMSDEKFQFNWPLITAVVSTTVQNSP
jgi:hypothetical protein